MNIHRLLTFLTATLLPATLFAQTPEAAPRGETIVKVFTNFHTGFGAINDQRGFQLDRSYLGYQYRLTDGLTIKAVTDIGQSKNIDDYHRFVYIKNAELCWKTGNWTLNGGLISTTAFNVQEKFWSYRYIMRTFQDKYRFGSSADLGISVAYRFNEIVTADAIVVNGEGYKKIQVGDGLLYGLGATVTPLKGLTVRLYGSMNEAADGMGKNTWNYALFAGYKHQQFHAGFEFNYMQNYLGKTHNDLYGFSLYGATHLWKNIELYARYDNLCSRSHRELDLEEHAAMIGAQFSLGKYVKLAPNLRITNPKRDGRENEYMAYLSCYFGL